MHVYYGKGAILLFGHSVNRRPPSTPSTYHCVRVCRANPRSGIVSVQHDESAVAMGIAIDEDLEENGTEYFLCILTRIEGNFEGTDQHPYHASQGGYTL